MSTDAGIEDDVREDAELIAAVRGGDVRSTGELYERHAGAALVVARRYTDSTADAEDVVADSFAAVFLALQRGNGPDVAFRAYLFTVVRRVAGLQRTRARRAEPTDDVASLEAGTAWAGSAEEPALEGFERGVVARAFHGLPERWQAVLWHTEVEGLQPAQIAPILGLTANGVAALAYRAREGLRQAYLQQHLTDPLDEGCRSVAGKLGSYVRGGLGSRENGQVESHLEECGECRALVLELTDVNHGMRAVIAPLVLGLAGVGALAHLLPVGGGLAAGAALAAGNGQGAAAGTATAGAGGAAAVAAGGGAGSAASAGGVAAFLSAIPATAVAVVAGAVVVAGIATAIVVGILNGPDHGAAPIPTTSASSTLDEPTAHTSSPVPTDAPTAAPTSTPRPTAPVPTVPPGSSSEPGSDPTAAPTSAPTPAPTDAPPTDDPTPDPTATPTDPPTDPPPTDPPAEPASLSVVLPDVGLALEAGAQGQELAIDVANTGGTAARDLAADVELPAGVGLDDVVTVTTPGVTGRFAAAVDPGWVCTGGHASPMARCTLDVLPPKTTASLVLRVSVDEDYEAADGVVSLHVTGAGLDFQAKPIPVRVAPARPRLALVGKTPSVALVTHRAASLTLPLRNAGGLSAAEPRAELTLPTGVTWKQVDDAWTCTGSEGPGAGTSVVRCSLDAALPGHATTSLALQLTADEPEAVEGGLSLRLSPTGWTTPAPLAIGYTVKTPARLLVTSAEQIEVLGGHAVPVKLAVEDVGGLDADQLTVDAAAPEGSSWGKAVPAGWACVVEGRTITCTRDVLAAGDTAPLALELLGAVGRTGPLGDVVVSASAAGADAADDVRIPVVGVEPALSIPDAAAHLLDDGTVQIELAVAVAEGSDAAGAVARATLPANLVLVPSDASTPGCGPVGESRVVECELGDVVAGTTVPVLFHTQLRWSDPAARVTLVARSGDVQSDAVRVAVPARSGGLAARFIGSGMGVTEIGAPLLSCRTSDKACASILTYGSSDNNGIVMDPLDEAAPPASAKRTSIPVSSTATLGSLRGPVTFAGLYWAANKVGADAWSGDRSTVSLRGPGGSYVPVHGEVLSSTTDNAQRSYYQSFADVTDLVAGRGAGEWSLADAAVAAGRNDRDPTYFAGWALVVVYADGSASDVSVYDGGAWVGSDSAPPVFSFAAAAGTSARVGVVAWEGDYRGTGDALALSSPLCGASSTRLTPLRFDGALGAANNAFDSTATGWRAANSLGTDAKAFRPVTLACDVSSLTATTTGDQYLIGAITLRSEPPAPPELRLAGDQP